MNQKERDNARNLLSNFRDSIEIKDMGLALIIAHQYLDAKKDKKGISEVIYKNFVKSKTNNTYHKTYFILFKTQIDFYSYSLINKNDLIKYPNEYTLLKIYKNKILIRNGFALKLQTFNDILEDLRNVGIIQL